MNEAPKDNLLGNPDQGSSVRPLKRWQPRPTDGSNRLAIAIEAQNRIASFARRVSWLPGWRVDGDPAEPVQRWGEFASSEELRTRIRAGLLLAYVDACSPELNNSDYSIRLERLQTRTFDVIAGELLSGGLLTDGMLADRLHEMVADVTASAGMEAGSSPMRIKTVLHPRVCYWRAQIAGQNKGARGSTLADISDVPLGPPSVHDGSTASRPRRGRPRTKPNLHPEVEPFLEDVQKLAGHPITFTDFSRVSGFGDDTVFGAWRRGDVKRCQPAHARRFEKTLQYAPEEFLCRLNRPLANA